MAPYSQEIYTNGYNDDDNDYLLTIIADLLKNTFGNTHMQLVPQELLVY